MAISVSLSPRLHLHGCHFAQIQRFPTSPFRFITPRSRRRKCSISLYSCSHSDGELGYSWISTEKTDDGFQGWSAGQQSDVFPVRKCIPRFVIAGIGSSVLILLISLAHFSFTRNGIKLQLASPFQPLVEIFHSPKPVKCLKEGSEIVGVVETIGEDRHSLTKGVSDQTMNDQSSGTSPFKFEKLHSTPECQKSKASSHGSRPKGGKGKSKYKIVSAAADSTQQEALSLLQKLKIMESDAEPYELCTRREYARWFVKANSLLERDPRHRIVPSMLVAGSTIAAFDDVDREDPDFLFIQAIGESGIVASKLSAVTADAQAMSGGSSLPLDECIFSPESLISRLDLICWKAKVEYPVLRGTDEKMLRKSIGFMDLGTISLDVLQELFMDILAGDRSILRRVFGNVRRLQPFKPVTKAQVAVALASGRMLDAVRIEISRMEAERLSRLAYSKEIRSELLHKGDIQRFWEEKLDQERLRGLEVQKELVVASHDLAEERILYEKEKADHIKERAALDCQRKLLSCLKEQIDNLSDRLANDKVAVEAERQHLEELFIKLHGEHNAIFEAKSILEAEKEAFRLLRSWVEDGAHRSQFRAKVLKDAVRRWNWDSQGLLSKPVNSDS